MIWIGLGRKKSEAKDRSAWHQFVDFEGLCLNSRWKGRRREEEVKEAAAATAAE